MSASLTTKMYCLEMLIFKLIKTKVSEKKPVVKNKLMRLFFSLVHSLVRIPFDAYSSKVYGDACLFLYVLFCDVLRLFVSFYFVEKSHQKKAKRAKQTRPRNDLKKRDYW